MYDAHGPQSRNNDGLNVKSRFLLEYILINYVVGVSKVVKRVVLLI
jgi:hypothetical protein